MKELQIVISKLVKWGQTCDLKLNPDKTVIVILNKQKIHPNNYPKKLIIGNKTVPFSNTMSADFALISRSFFNLRDKVF